jgi:hypothetical protein
MALCTAGCILQAKLPFLDTQSGFPGVTILSASSVRTLVHCVVKYSRPPNLSVILKSQPPICLDYRACNAPKLRMQFNVLKLTNLRCHIIFLLSLCLFLRIMLAAWLQYSRSCDLQSINFCQRPVKIRD